MLHVSVHERPVGDNQRPRVCVQAEEALAAAETRMNNCVKGIIFYEIGRREYVAVTVSLHPCPTVVWWLTSCLCVCSADRHTCLKNSIAQFAALGVASAERSRRLWSALISDLAFDDSVRAACMVWVACTPAAV